MKAFLHPTRLLRLAALLPSGSAIGLNVASVAWAESASTAASKEPALNVLPYGQCFENAAKVYGVEADLLRSIAWRESKFNPQAHNTKNATPTEDIGIMQINSWWLDKLTSFSITRSDLWEPCTNIHVGAWILSHELARHSDTWTAVGYYNAKTKWKRDRYSDGVKAAYQALKSGALLQAYQKAATPTAQIASSRIRSDTLPTVPVVAAVKEAKQQPAKAKVSVAKLQARRKPEIVVVGDS